VARAYQMRDPDTVVGEGLTVTECYTLEVLARRGPFTVTEVARELGVDKSTSSRAITTLVEAGLARRADDPSEHRAWRVSATPRGKALHRQLALGVAHEYGPLLESLTPANRATVLEALAAIGEVTQRRLRRQVAEAVTTSRRAAE
jgi:DNA-binding MarR family transcriptional regulator